MFEPPDHARFMRRAIELGRRVPSLPFGAVLVHEGTHDIVAEGWNRSQESPIWHGEMDVIHHCALNCPQVDWSRLILYTTAEPCVMCQGAVAWAGLRTVVFGVSIRHLQRLGWWQIDILAEEVVRRTPFRECRIVGGVLEKECKALFEEAGRGQFRS